MKIGALLCLALALLAHAQGPDRDFPNDVNARQALQRGVAQYRAGKFAQAARYFQQAVDAAPESNMARVYLGVALMNQYVPGGESAGNAELAKRAEAEFLKVLSVDARDETALNYLANLHYEKAGAAPNYAAKAAELDRAAELFNRLVDVRPENKQTQLDLGIIAWMKWHDPWLEARSRAGLKPEDAGPLRDSKTRLELAAKYGAALDEGIAHLQAAVAMDPNFEGAMEYLNLLIRERADLADSKAAYEAAIEEADKWREEAGEAAKRTGPAAPPRPRF